MADLPDSISTLYVDESIHDALKFIVSAFVFSTRGLDGLVRQEIRAVGLTPGDHEFKSGHRMASDSRMQELRERLLDIVAERTRIALLVVGPGSRSLLVDCNIDFSTSHRLPFVHGNEESSLGAAGTT